MLRSMALDEELAGRVRELLALREGFSERRMFGGMGFMLHGNMACGVTSTGELMVRVSPEDFEAALREPHTRQFEMSGKRMGGWLLVDSEGTASDEELASWVDAGAGHAASLAPK